LIWEDVDRIYDPKIEVPHPLVEERVVKAPHVQVVDEERLLEDENPVSLLEDTAEATRFVKSMLASADSSVPTQHFVWEDVALAHPHDAASIGLLQPIVDREKEAAKYATVENDQLSQKKESHVDPSPAALIKQPSLGAPAEPAKVQPAPEAATAVDGDYDEELDARQALAPSTPASNSSGASGQLVGVSKTEHSAYASLGEAALTSTVPEPAQPAWSYADASAWKNSFPACGGSQQSPIDLQFEEPNSTVDYLSQLRFTWKSLENA
jgi:hypothetical protein